MVRADLNPPQSARICSDHFSESSIKRQGTKVTLKRGSIPSRFKSHAEYMKLSIDNPLHSVLHDLNFNLWNSNEEGYASPCISAWPVISDTAANQDVLLCVKGISCGLQDASSYRTQQDFSNAILEEKVIAILSKPSIIL